MYISINWIKDFVNLDGVDIDNLINRFTLSTAEVEGIEKHGYDIQNVIAGKIIDVQKHPNSDKLKIVKVDTGKEIVQSLCGAPNVAINQIVPFAPIGSKIREINVEETKIAGEKSCGICLSEKELGISDDHSGLMLLDENTVVGTDIKDIMDIEDIIFEVDNKSLTNRPDLWGHYGIAREIAAIVGRQLKPLEVDNVENYSNLPKLDIKVEDSDRCYRYSGITIENISKRVSDLNMRIRLFYTGTRSINLLADITNYIMLELGQPMHAFDKSIVDHVNIKTLGNEQKFVTLDGIERNIYDDTLMICKDNNPICIAGIMGGENTEIKDTTNSLFLESANFDSVSVRKSSIKLGLRTEASARYEKTLDPEMTVIAIARYIKLLKDMDKDIKITSSVTDVYVKKYDTITIDISKQYIDTRIGKDIPIDDMENILTSLEFKVTRSGNNMTVVVPSHRATKDVSMKADLVEEIARIHGYDNIEPKTKIDSLRIVSDSDERVLDYTIKDVLAQKYGLSEVHSYIWYNNKQNNELKIQTNNNIKIINSLNADNNVLRESMLPILLNMLNQNIKHYNDVNIFEIGKVFTYPKKDENCIENKNLGIVLASKNLTEKEVMEKAIKLVRTICKLTKNIVPQITDITSKKYNWINDINASNIGYNNTNLGYVSVLNIGIKNEIDKKMNAVVIEMYLDKLNELSKQENKFSEITKYQTVNIDLSLVVDKDTKYSVIENYIKDAKTNYLISFELIDVFENIKTLENKKSITIRFILGSYEKTLTNDEISQDMNSLIECFENNGVIIRK